MEILQGGVIVDELHLSNNGEGFFANFCEFDEFANIVPLRNEGGN